MVKETTIPRKNTRQIVPRCFGLCVGLIHTNNRKQELWASSDFVNKKRSADGDDQAEGSVAKGELSTLVSNGLQI